MTVRKSHLDTFVGRLTLVAHGEALSGVYFEAHRHAPPLDMPFAHPNDPLLERARGELSEYFAGRRRMFDLPLAPRGTAFQRAVWSALVTIPFGTTISYAELARRAGRPGAARAAGAANGKNPLSIVLPCHRVVGAGGALTGYAGGLANKRLLLEHEARCAQARSGLGRDEHFGANPEGAHDLPMEDAEATLHEGLNLQWTTAPHERRTQLVNPCPNPGHQACGRGLAHRQAREA